MTAVMRSPRIKVRLCDPILFWRNRAPVIVFQHVPVTSSCRFSTPMKNTLMVNTQRTGRAVGQNPLVILIPLGWPDVTFGHEFRRPQLNWGILGEIENLDKIDFRAEDMVRVMMPPLGGCRAFDVVMACYNWQANVSAEQ